MKTIHKYSLVLTDEQAVLMPLGAEVLSVQVQNDVLCAWASVDATNPKTDRVVFRIFGTGNPRNDDGFRFLGTVQHGAFVWHVFVSNK